VEVITSHYNAQQWEHPMTDRVVEEIDQRLKQLARQCSKIPDGDPRRAEIENEISLLCLQRHMLKSRADRTS
jgi:Mn-dependent DtxR family transcriptional regulator